MSLPPKRYSELRGMNIDDSTGLGKQGVKRSLLLQSVQNQTGTSLRSQTQQIIKSALNSFFSHSVVGSGATSASCNSFVYPGPFGSVLRKRKASLQKQISMLECL